MGRTPTDYSKTQMYKLCCRDLEIKEIYIGHTTNWRNRKNQHRIRANNCDFPVYQFIRENGGWDNWKMVWIEDYPCENKRQAEKRETELIHEYKATLNSTKRPYTSEEQRREYIRKKDKKRHRESEARIKWRKEYNSREDVKEKKRECDRLYREKNRDELNRRLRERRHINKLIDIMFNN